MPVPREAQRRSKRVSTLRLDEGTEGFALGGEGGLLAVELGLAKADALAGLVEGGGERLDLGAGGGERGFLSFGALQAGEGLVFQALGLGLGKVKLVLDGLGLIGGGEGVLLVAVAGGLLAVGGDLAFQAGAEGLLAAEGGGGLGGLTLGGGEGGLGLGDFRWQGARGLRQAACAPVPPLAALRDFQSALASVIEVYGMGRGFRKWIQAPSGKLSPGADADYSPICQVNSGNQQRRGHGN